MSYTPDGIILQNNKPYKLVEIKCPFKGKKTNIQDLIKNLKFLTIQKDGKVSFKRKHQYYCQIQLGMAILNVNATDFVVYASHDASFFTLTVPYDENYMINVLKKVKPNYLLMLQYVNSNEKKLNFKNLINLFS